MVKVKTTSSTSTNSKKMRPALSPEAEENQMIYLATDLAKKQLMEGTASSQVITHFLKLGTVKEKLELKKLERENQLLEAKTKAIVDTADVKEIYEAAIKAMQRYGGHGDSEDEEYY